MKAISRMAALLLAAASLASLGAANLARAAEFDDIVLSASKDADENTESFAADTARIYAGADFRDVAAGSKIAVAWIAVDSKGAAPPNYKIDEVSFDVGSLENHVDSSISRPNAGWPAGSYQVQFLVDGKVEKTADFTIE